ncbi:hypothetical protein HSBAA_54190 [Vreelandella sulfidaeris]|uniref:Uncharacterized protein n=1 Tax=Vreelandella sulfidaeris TaxID=115553 RepID=A0A455UFL4_9GAMM|nr:hypothetical protein HSBAA_54190 [Halomonas sulfidaeris]
MAFELKALPASVVVLLLEQMPSIPLSARDWQDIEDVATAHRDPVLARPALQALAREASRCALTEMQQQSLRQVAAWALQNRALTNAHNDAVKALRLAVNNLIEPVK